MTSQRSGACPPLLRISELEAQSIASAFRLYDYKATGKIPRYLAKKLTKSLGYRVPVQNMSNEISLQELLLFLDSWTPEPEPAIDCALYTFTNLITASFPEIGESSDNSAISDPTIRVQDIATFMEALGRPPPSMGEAKLLLTSMLDYDDCSTEPVVRLDTFKKHMLLFARKNNMVKELKHIV